MSSFKKAYSPATLADRWSCSAEKVRGMLRSGELRGFRSGRSLRISAEEVARFEGGPDDQPSSEATQPALHVPISHRFSDWPQAMQKKTAALYCDLSIAAFLAEVQRGRLPPSFQLGGRAHWHRPALDQAFAALTGNQMSEAERAFWAKAR